MSSEKRTKVRIYLQKFVPSEGPNFGEYWDDIFTSEFVTPEHDMKQLASDVAEAIATAIRGEE